MEDKINIDATQDMIDAQGECGKTRQVLVVFNYSSKPTDQDGPVAHLDLNAAVELDNGQTIRSLINIFMRDQTTLDWQEKEEYIKLLAGKLEATGLFEVRCSNWLNVMTKDGTLTPDIIKVVMECIADTGGADRFKTTEVIEGTRVFSERYMAFRFS